MKFILTTDNAGAIPAHFRKLEIAADEGKLTVADVRFTESGQRPPAIVDAAKKLVAQANAADDLLAACKAAVKAIVVPEDTGFAFVATEQLKARDSLIAAIEKAEGAK